MLRVDGSITRCFRLIRNGDTTSFSRLWERYFPGLTRLARRWMSANHCRISDDEDVVISVFDAIARGAEAGKFSNLRDRDELWRLMVSITRHKVRTKTRMERRTKRGFGRILRQPTISNGTSVIELSLDDIHGSNGSSPESLASIVDQYRFLLARLGDDSLKAVVAGTLKGESHEQMALKLGVTERTIRRKLQVVRSIWRTELNG